MSKKNNYKVYVHINKINGKRYYGITKLEVNRRWRNGKGYKSQQYFYRAICKYGWNNFEHIILFDNLTKEEACLLEQMYIALYDTNNREKGYNETTGGENYNHTEESRKKLSEAHKGKTRSEESRRKQSEANKGKNNPFYGKNHSEETRKKMSENHVDFKGENHPNYGKHLSEESRKKISEAKKGKNKGKNNPRAIKIYCVELDMYFDTIKQASEILGCDRNNISSVLRGKSKTAGGYHFIYANEVNEENINKVMSQEKYTSIKGKNNPRATKVYCVELNMYFDTITEASKIIGCDKANISAVLKGKNKTCGGYHWLYAEDVEKLDIENNKVS